MKALIKIKQSPIMDRRHVEERDDKTNYRTQTEVCGFGARTPRSVNRIHSRVCAGETREHSFTYSTNRHSRITNIPSCKQHRPSSWNGWTPNFSRSNNKTAQSVNLFLDNVAQCATFCTSYNLGGAA